MKKENKFEKFLNATIKEYAKSYLKIKDENWHNMVINIPGKINIYLDGILVKKMKSLTILPDWFKLKK